VRGHAVTLFEKSGELGGAILGCCMTPGKEKMKWYADWIRNQLKKLPVDVRLNTAPGVDDLKSSTRSSTPRAPSAMCPTASAVKRCWVSRA
jgi:NADPH-dependent 2,4-dienoyl-CoA reductase/sulfur reductase-like enzyme